MKFLHNKSDNATGNSINILKVTEIDNLYYQKRGEKGSQEFNLSKGFYPKFYSVSKQY